MPDITSPWVPSDPHRAASKLDEEGDQYLTPSLPERKAQKWRPSVGSVELQGFASGGSSATGHLSLRIPLQGAATGTGSATGNLTIFSDEEIAEAHLKAMTTTNVFPKTSSSSHTKAAVYPSALPFYISEEQAKILYQQLEIPSLVVDTHLKIVMPASGFPVSNLSTHVKGAVVADVDPRLGDTHIKIVESEPGDLTNGDSHMKVECEGPWPLLVGKGPYDPENPQHILFPPPQGPHVKVVRSDPLPLFAEHTHVVVATAGPKPQKSYRAHVKVMESEPGDLQNLDDHVKISQDGALPLLNGEASVKVAHTDDVDPQAAQAHLKYTGIWVPHFLNLHEHVKTATGGSPWRVNHSAHTKAAQAEDPDDRVGDMHLKMVVPFNGNQKRGWGILV